MLLVPIVLALLLAALTLIDGQDSGERWDADPVVYAYAGVAAGAIMAFLLAVGVALSRLRP